jgi:hypothetical protein
MMWKNILERGRPQMTIWRMGIACWIPKATNTHAQYVTLIAFPQQQRLHERCAMLRYTHIACLVDLLGRVSVYFFVSKRRSKWSPEI